VPTLLPSHQIPFNGTTHIHHPGTRQAPREWSRLSEELQQERVRLGNRIRQQLWRYYPQLLDLTDDVAAE